jgi:hypothetical protein
MQSFNIVGTFTFAETLKTLKLGDKVKLIPNPDNKINPNAIGVYTRDNKKIGYLPFNMNQVELTNEDCIITQLVLLQGNTNITISRKYKKNNFLLCYPKLIQENNILRDYLKDDIKKFKKFLIINNNNIDDIYISYYDENYIDLYIKNESSTSIFNTVTKKYYDEHIFKYDEFYELKLVPKNIYQQFMIHRLECYIEKKYDLVKLNITKHINKTNYINIHNSIKYNNKDNIKIAIKFILSNDKYYEKYLQKINYDLSLILQYKDQIYNFFKDYNITEIAYNHTTKKYCNIDLYNNDTIVLIDEYNKRDYTKLLKITEYQNIIIYDPFEGNIYKNNL